MPDTSKMVPEQYAAFIKAQAEGVSGADAAHWMNKHAELEKELAEAKLYAGIVNDDCAKFATLVLEQQARLQEKDELLSLANAEIKKSSVWIVILGSIVVGLILAMVFHLR